MTGLHLIAASRPLLFFFRQLLMEIAADFIFVPLLSRIFCVICLYDVHYLIYRSIFNIPKKQNRC